MRGLTLVVLACVCFLTKTSAEELTHQQAVNIIAGALKDAIYKEVAKEITKDVETNDEESKDQQDAAMDVLEKDALVEENLDLKDAADPYGSLAVAGCKWVQQKEGYWKRKCKKDELEAPEEDGASAVEKREEVDDPLNLKLKINLTPKKKKTKGYCPTSKPFAFNGGSHCCASKKEGKSKPIKPSCNGGALTLASTCCDNNKLAKCTKDVCSNSPLKMAYAGKCTKIMTKDSCRKIAAQKHAKDNTIKGELVTHFWTSILDPKGCSYRIEKVGKVQKITQVVWNGSWVHASCSADRPCICINA